MKIITTFGGPCIYKQGILPDGTKTGRIMFTNQSQEQLERELRASVETGRDDVTAFVDTIVPPHSPC